MLAIPTIFTSHTPEVGPFDLHLYKVFHTVSKDLGASWSISEESKLHLAHITHHSERLPSMSGFQSVDVSGDSHWATKLSKFKATGMELKEVWLTLA